MTSPSFEVKRPTTGTGGDWPTGECWMTAGNPYKQHKVRATSPPPLHAGGGWLYSAFWCTITDAASPRACSRASTCAMPLGHCCL